MARPTKLVEAFDWFYACLSDQMGHLDGAHADGAEYVGRRLDQSWRWIEYWAMMWLDKHAAELQGAGQCEHMSLDFDGDEQVADGERHVMTDAHRALDRARELRAEFGSGTGLEPHREAFEHLRVVDHAMADLLEAIKNEDVRAAAIASHVSRRAYSSYRVAKYRWLDEALERGDLPEDNSYCWLEA